MFFLSGKGCSEFPKRMLISIGILNTIVKVCELKNTNRLLNLCIINSINNTDKFFVRLIKTFPYESKQHHPNNHNEKAISYIIARFFPFHDCFPTIFNIFLINFFVFVTNSLLSSVFGIIKEAAP